MSEKNDPPINDNSHSEDDAVPFERWLDKKLKTAYGSVLEEPIPEDLIRLLQQKLDNK